MNKDLVKQLAEKAGFTAGAERYSTPDYQTVEPELLEKFAELIVRECMREADLPLRADGKYDHLLPSQMIAKHFAMEEQTSWS